jgi:hypothetical protein
MSVLALSVRRLVCTFSHDSIFLEVANIIRVQDINKSWKQIISNNFVSPCHYP